MTEDATSSAPTRGPGIVLTLVGVLVAALVGGVAGGLIVRATWGSGNRSSATATGSNGTSAACPAANVADEALPSVVTVRAGNGREAAAAPVSPFDPAATS